MLGGVARGNNTGWHYRTALCPECKQMTIELSPPLSQELREQLGNKVKNTNMHLMGNVSDRFVQSNSEWRQVHPIGSNRGPVSPEVPPPIAADYVEACNVLPISVKASAALSRRCLQVMLREQGYKDKDLWQQIDKLLNAGVLPTHIQTTVDAIRHFGNFGAHPINDITTLQVIDVQSGEAEWCLAILEALFDHFYVRPAADKKRIAELNATLAAAGKPPSKS
jgi:hypothetical protein